MYISIESIPHKNQRYPTVGDWYFDDEDNPTVLYIKVSKMDNLRYEFLVAYHEIIEAMICLKDGIKETDVTAFDMAFEDARLEGDLREPGDSEDAPYHNAHIIATANEKQMATLLGVEWDRYEEAVNAL